MECVGYICYTFISFKLYVNRMVEEILNTRIMVKKSMKEHKDNKGLHRLLDARQLGLKLIANVTYGYTGANFSGRMPCIEVRDHSRLNSQQKLIYPG